ncbi:MAG: hypothetical protein ICV66_13705, partial [Chitinophagaceae bacterium]|nr:hypothetical protein [Chitinophagaceae bacterium]
EQLSHQSPFGLIIINNAESGRLFENAYKYQPEYFLIGIAVDILQNNNQPDLPWTCRMPLRREKNTERATVNHKNKINSLSKATFEYSGSGAESYESKPAVARRFAPSGLMCMLLAIFFQLNNISLTRADGSL